MESDILQTDMTYMMKTNQLTKHLLRLHCGWLCKPIQARTFEIVTNATVSRIF